MRILAGIVSILLISIRAMAFGQEGHEAVCQIAYDELNTKAREAVDRLIALEPVPEDRLFRVGCRWPDRYNEFPEDLRPRSADHYINLPRGTKALDGRCYDKYGAEVAHCLFKAIDQDKSVLLDPHATDDAKLKALKFLGHWIGDIHQPLHVSYADDRGGNEVIADTDGCRDTLHAVWDTCLPRDLMIKAHLDPYKDRGRFGDILWKEITSANRNAWLRGSGPSDWANESYAIAKRRDVGYCVKVHDVCQYDTDNVEYHGGQKRVVEVGNAYKAEFDPVDKQRIEQAGVRLGAMLNAIFGS